MRPEKLTANRDRFCLVPSLPLFATSRIVLALGLLLGSTASAFAQPVIESLSPLSLHHEQATQLTFKGKGLETVSEILFRGDAEFTILKQSDSELVASLSIQDVRQTGIVGIRLLGEEGVSNTRYAFVDSCTQLGSEVPFDGSPQSKTDQLTGAETKSFPLQLEAQANLTVEVISNRFGGNWKPVVRILNSKGAQVAWSNPQPKLGGDALASARLEAGTYSIQVHDLLLRARGKQPFLLRVGDFYVTQYALPAFANPEIDTQIKLPAQFPKDEKPRSITANANALQLGWNSLILPTASSWAGQQPAILVHRFAANTNVEAETGLVDSESRSPVVFQGVIDESTRTATHQCQVVPGKKYRFEVFAQRIGSELDSVLTIRRSGGGQLARGDDQPGTSDSKVEFTAPQDCDQVTLIVNDLLRTASKDHIYQIIATDVSQGELAPKLQTDRIQVPQNGHGLLEVELNRKGLAGPIQIELPEMNPAILTEGKSVGAHSDRALISVRPTDGPFNPQLTRVLFYPKQQPSLLFLGRLPEHPSFATSPWLANDLAVVMKEPSPVQFSADLSESTQYWLGGQAMAKLEFTASEDAGMQTPLNVRMVTSQVPPQKTEKIDNKDQQVTDLERTLRQVNSVEWKPGVTEAAAQIQIPADLQEGTWQVAWKLESGEMGSATTINASPVYDLKVQRAFRVTLSEPAQPKSIVVEQTVAWTGKLERLNQFAGPVTISVKGLPDGLTATPITVPSSETEFSITVSASPESKPAKVSNVTLLAIAYSSEVNSDAEDQSIPIASATSSPFELEIKTPPAK